MKIDDTSFITPDGNISNSAKSFRPKGKIKQIDISKPLRPLTPKQKIFVKEIVENPTQPAYKAVELAGYNAKDKNVASSIAVENLQKPAIMLELAKHSQTAELVLLEVLNTSNKYSKQGNTAGASYASTAVSAANSILDRLHGKATQRVEQTTQAVTLNIDLTAKTDKQ